MATPAEAVRGAGFLRTRDDGKLFEKLVLLREFLVMADVGLGEGDCVAPVCVDSDIVATDEDGHDGNDCIWRQFLNVVPRQCDGVLHGLVEALIHHHDERLQSIIGLSVDFISGYTNSSFLSLTVC